MITSATAGYLVDNTLTCSVGSRSYTKANSIPAIGVVIAKDIPSEYGTFKGLFLISDNPNAVMYNTEGISFGFATNAYVAPNGIVWYYSVTEYYMGISETYSGSVIDMSSNVYTQAEIDAFKPIKDILALALPTVTPDSGNTLYPSQLIVNAGSSYSGWSTMYWWMFDNDTSTSPDYTDSDGTVTFMFPKTINVSAIDYAPRPSWGSRLEGSTVTGLTTSGTWETICTISSVTDYQIDTIQVSTGHKYVAIRLQCPYLNISVFNIHGTYNNEFIDSKYYKFDFMNCRSWYTNKFCLSDIGFTTANGGAIIADIQAVCAGGNSEDSPSYQNYTSLSNLADADPTTQCDISWYAGKVISITCQVLYWGGDVSGYTLTTSDSDTEYDPASWRLWVSSDNKFWNILDAVTEYALPTARKTTQSFTLTAATRTNLTYIQSDGSQFINTLVYGTQDTDTEAVFARYMPYDYSPSNHDSWGGIISGRQGHSDTAYDVTISQGRNVVVYQYGNTSEEYSCTLDIGTTYTLSTQGSSIYLNSTLLGTNSSGTFTTPAPMTIFARNTNGEAWTGLGEIEYAAIRLYSCKIWQNSTLVRNFTPCRIKGVVGLYDSVTDSFFTSWGGYDLIGSDSVPSDTYVETDGDIAFGTGIAISSGKMKCELDIAYVDFDNSPCILSNRGSGDNIAGDLVCDLYGSVFDIKDFYDQYSYRSAYIGKSYFNLAPYVRTKLTVYASAANFTAIAYGRSGHSDDGQAINQQPFYLCCNGAGLNNKAKIRIYSVKIWDDKTLVADINPSFAGAPALVNAVTQSALTSYGSGTLSPIWFIIDGEITNVTTPTPLSFSEPYPSEFWSFEGTTLVNLLNPATIPTSTPPYPSQLWVPDNGLITGFMLENPLIGAFCHSSIRKIYIPESVKKIGKYAFTESAITAVTIAADCEYDETSFPPGCRIYRY